jgi:hypothetical protein
MEEEEDKGGNSVCHAALITAYLRHSIDVTMPGDGEDGSSVCDA